MRFLILGLLMLSPAARAQKEAKPVFEAASIKMTDPKGGGGHSHERDAPGMLRASMTLKSYIMAAYGVKPYQVIGGPNWIDATTYEIVAKLERTPDAPPLDSAQRKSAGGDEQSLHVALQTLLTERFQLKFHRETKDLPAYALAMAKGGFKLKESTAKGKCGTDSAEGPGRNIVATCVDMESLMRFLARQVDRPIFDQTHLQGRYDFTLQWAPDNLKGGDSTDQPALPSLFTALQERLGLRIEPIKAAVDLIVVDNAERPTEN